MDAETDDAEASAASALTENEGNLLALVVRTQPVTAYQLIRMYEQSPTPTISSSKGSVYPMIRRLTRRGFLRTEAVSGDRRNPETLHCTEAGLEAVRQWVKGLRSDHALIGDPMRTRILSFDLLSRDEQIEWIVNAKALLEAKRQELDEYSRSVSVPFQEIVHASAISALDGKHAWLDRLLHAVVKGRPQSPT
jgi:DNA-binding PadR family transcriptional regulator